ncbi:MAG: arginine--tRNA ligase [Fimbriimonadaceae bacterium]|nr:arginine--tRNA ligase [Fimbriimonadaceae bacterium]
MKKLISQAIREALHTLEAGHPGFDADAVDFQVTPPTRRDHGDWATNAAMIASGLLEVRDRRGLAEMLAAALRFPEGTVERVEVAGPGFLNFFVDDRWYQHLVGRIVAADQSYGRLTAGDGQSVLAEFVSANPTGPLTVGHGRNAILGDVLARLYEWAGYTVTREYYFNNAGRQMRVLGESVRARYLAQLGRPAEFPEDGYQGEYIVDIAAALRAEHGEGVADASLDLFRSAAERAIFQDIRVTCERLGIRFDSFFNEQSLYDDGSIDAVVAALRAQDLAYDQDGAVWFRSTACGLDRDVVIIKSSGEPTYRLPDMAYHRQKLRRGFNHLVDVFGADHIDTCQEVLAAVRALGDSTDRVHVVIYQFVTLQRGGQVVKMSTRKANFETLDDLVEEVGADAVRYFFAMRSPRSHLEFDLDLAKKRANDNPMYYVQYAHARISSLLAKPEAAELQPTPLDLAALEHEAERHLVTTLALLPETLQRALAEHEPHRLTTYAAEVATAFHAFYDRCPVLAAPDRRIGRARLELTRAAGIVLRNILRMIGVAAPESM